MIKSSIPAERVIELAELRIGNILSYDGRFVHVTNLSCDIDDEYTDIIGFCELGKSSNEKSDWNRALCDKLDRIPLTESILEKSGFVEYSGKHFQGWAYYGDYKGTTPFEDAVSPLLVLTDYLDPCNFLEQPLCDTDLKLEYVHQLQNLFYALTGTELIINL